MKSHISILLASIPEGTSYFFCGLCGKTGTGYWYVYVFIYTYICISCVRLGLGPILGGFMVRFCLISLLGLQCLQRSPGPSLVSFLTKKKVILNS